MSTALLDHETAVPVPTENPPPLALKFLSGKYRGSEFPLGWDEEYVIGRAPEIEISLVEDLVSRKHARVSTRGGEVAIEDLGSTNGTFVNGQKVRRAILKEGDRILIGTSILQLGRYDGLVPGMVEREVEDKTMTAPALFGSLSAVPMTSLIELLATSRKTGVLVVESDHVGHLHFRDGQLAHATIDERKDIAAAKALPRILGFSTGNYTFDAKAAPADPGELSGASAAVLIEATRQMDEFRHARESLPAGAVDLILRLPLVPLLSALDAERLDLFQQAVNLRSVDAVLDASEKSDVEAIEAIVGLVDQGYLVATARDNDDDDEGTPSA